ncbi:membrane protein [Paraburkholderia tuberum]|uniref:membrane protein n=1 Tax=Paraburkholderia TaxID=1822464 RepID=UPI0003687478|nr:membrane protein [Paraburkholderia tuberum]
MDATGHTEQENVGDREPVLDVVDRVCESCFGLFMALTFVGTVSAVGAGADAGHKMFYTALGCNLAWGLADAVMFLVRTLVARGRRVTLAHSVRSQPNAAAGVRTLHDAMSAWLRPLIGDTELESIRRRVAARPDLPQRAVFVRDDFIAAAAIFVLVVAATFPVALPFVLFANVPTALIASRVLTIAMLFGSGMALGHYAGFRGWQAGLAMAAVGVLLTVAIIALGG